MTRQRGFTLIEMAMVVAIIGVIVGGGIVAIGPITQAAKVNQTNTSLDQIESALTLFAIRNGRLPCPADGALANTDIDYGIENPTPPAAGTGCTFVSGAATLTNSIIPWKTLGLDETYSVDGWGNRISYFPANSQVDATIDSVVDSSTGVARACDADASGALCTLCLSRTTAASPAKSTRATLCDINNQKLTPSYPYGNYIAVYSITATPPPAPVGSCNTELTMPNTNNANLGYSGTDSCIPASAPAAAVAVTATNVAYDGLRAAYVLISHGPSGWYGWTKGGTQVKPLAGAYILKGYNSGKAGANVLAGSANNYGFVQGTPQSLNTRSNASYFDDIVRWRSPSFIIQQCGSGACGNP